MRMTIVASALVAALASPAQANDDDVQECPPAFLGARVTTFNVTDGVVLEFKNPDRTQVQEMRAELREVAILIEQHSTQTQTASFDEEVDFPPVDMNVKDIANGARVTVHAARRRDIPALRELALGFVAFWKQSPCVTSLVVTKT